MQNKISFLNHPKWILLYSIFVTGLLFLIENVYHPVYLLQLIQKLASFFLIPIMLAYFFEQMIGRAGKFQKSSILYGVGFWLLSAGIITITYLLLSEYIDWQAIRSSMEARQINEKTFIAVFLYIMFGNSLLEEYFFRGIVHYQTSKLSKNGAYLLSALLFSLYHMVIFATWFSGYILALALFGLFLGWVFFSWLYEKTGGIWSAWIFHIFADLTILAIGYIEFFH